MLATNMKKMLIITTVNDLAVPLFLVQRIQKKLQIDFCFFHETTNIIKEKIISNNYRYIYIRDPFNYVFDKDNIKEKFDIIMSNSKNGHIIDNLSELNDIYLEDKWKQYQLFSKFMPKTRVLTSSEEADDDNFITKKRISSRAKGIVFNSKGLKNDNLSDYIIQNKIKIEKEYRIYVIFNEILEEALLKRPKTQSSRVKVIGREKLPATIIDFVKNIIKKNKFDFIGLDIAKQGDNLYLLEVNRSCLFNGYFSTTGINLAELFIDKLLEKNNFARGKTY